MEPIIKSLLDTDFYKFTMGQVILKNFRNAQVTFGLTNRTRSVSLPKSVDIGELREQLEHVRTLKPLKTETYYLRGMDVYGKRMFEEPFLDFFENLQLPPFNLAVRGDQFLLEFSGDWPSVTYWEIYALSILNELYFRSQTRKMTRFEKEALRAEGVRRLQEKIFLLRKYPELFFIEFGTRRRYSREWQEYVTTVMAEELPNQLRGTSNTDLARRLNLVPMGTSAHELDMVAAGLNFKSDDDIRASHNKMLQLWWAQYGEPLSVALTDTFGSEFFFRDMTEQQARDWRGTRQDSGNPIAYGEKVIKFYQGLGINHKEKLLIPSDGLDPQKMVQIFEPLHDRIKLSFGWGTNLTNDLGIPALSLVIKAIQANEHPLVKLSDNLAKAIGPAAEVERYKRIFGYTGTFQEQCTY